MDVRLNVPGIIGDDEDKDYPYKSIPKFIKEMHTFKLNWNQSAQRVMQKIWLTKDVEIQFKQLTGDLESLGARQDIELMSMRGKLEQLDKEIEDLIGDNDEEEEEEGSESLQRSRNNSDIRGSIQEMKNATKKSINFKSEEKGELTLSKFSRTHTQRKGTAAPDDIVEPIETPILTGVVTTPERTAFFTVNGELIVGNEDKLSEIESVNLSAAEEERDKLATGLNTRLNRLAEEARKSIFGSGNDQSGAHTKRTSGIMSLKRQLTNAFG